MLGTSTEHNLIPSSEGNFGTWDDVCSIYNNQNILACDLYLTRTSLLEQKPILLMETKKQNNVIYRSI